jgi:hypothetical protein
MAVEVSWAWPSRFWTWFRGDAGGDGRHAEAVPEPLGCGLGAIEAGGCQDSVHGAPARGRVQRAGQGSGHGAVDLPAGMDTGGEVHPIGGERQSLGEAAAGIGQGALSRYCKSERR